MSTTSIRRLGEELHELLHPADPRDVPTPGFPTHEALIAWARSKPARAVIDAAVDVLRVDEWPQQYAAMGLLRSLGVDVEGQDHGEDFRWMVQEPRRKRQLIIPAIRDRQAPAGPRSVAVPRPSVG